MYASQSWWKPIRAWIFAVAVSFPTFIANQEARAADSSEMLTLRAITQPGSPLTDKDCELAVFARQALLKDGILCPLNLGVTVRSGTATLWGTVPTVALARRAEEKIRSVPGLAQVRNELRISVNDEATAEFLSGPAYGSTTALEEHPRRRERTIPLMSQESSKTAGTIPQQVMPPIQVKVGPARTVSAFEPSGPFSPFHGRMNESIVEAKPTRTVSAPSSLVETLESLRRSNERFRTIRFQMQGSFVQLWGNGANPQDVFSFAQRASHLPGVQCVIVERWQ